MLIWCKSAVKHSLLVSCMVGPVFYTVQLYFVQLYKPVKQTVLERVLDRPDWVQKCLEMRIVVLLPGELLQRDRPDKWSHHPYLVFNMYLISGHAFIMILLFLFSYWQLKRHTRRLGLKRRTVWNPAVVQAAIQVNHCCLQFQAWLLAEYFYLKTDRQKLYQTLISPYVI